MAKPMAISIQESERMLLSLLNKHQGKLLLYQRVKALLLVKQGKVTYTYQLAKKLKGERKTIYNWLKLYQQSGITGYLKIKNRGLQGDSIPLALKQEIGQKLCDPSTQITSYVELLDWVRANYNLKLSYHTFYRHCRAHHNSVLKVARKSHHKKDAQAVEDFKKNFQAS